MLLCLMPFVNLGVERFEEKRLHYVPSTTMENKTGVYTVMSIETTDHSWTGLLSAFFMLILFTAL